MEWYPGRMTNFLLDLLLPAKGHPLPEPKLPEHEFNSKQDFSKPDLWKYYPDTSADIWFAKNYKDYIMPDNALVQYFIDHTTLKQENGMLVIMFKSGGPVIFSYRKDDGKLCREAGQEDTECYSNMDFWQNPDYYLWNNFEGDCEDYALLWGSMLDNLGIPYMIVSGYFRYTKDWWVEFIHNGKPYMAQVNRYLGSAAGPIDHSSYHPYMMFNRRTDIRDYTEWYNDPALNRSSSKAILV